MTSRCLLAGLALLGLSSAIGASVVGSPNFVLLMTDDQAWDAFGLLEPLVSTPHLDALASTGSRFDNAFVSTSICPASRASILTGLHYPTHGYTFQRPTLDDSELETSWPALLRAAGYRVGFLGKNGLDLEAAQLDLLFDSWQLFPREYFIDIDGEERHLTDHLASLAADFIAAQSAEQPFVLIVWFHAPHAAGGFAAEPFVPPRRYESLYNTVLFPRRPGSDPTVWAQRPAFLDLGLNRQRRDLWWSDDRYQHNSRRYHAMIRAVDDAVGTTRDALAVSGFGDTTVTIFLSDNGFYRGERLFGGKWLGHDASIRVPLLIRVPGTAPRAVPEMVINVDLARTVLDLAALPAPASMQGASLVPLIQGEPVAWRDDFFIEHSFVPRGQPEIPRFYGVRTPQWKYLRYRDHDHEQLYDLEGDPDEIVNRAGDPTVAGVLETLRARTDELLFQYGGIFADGFESGATDAWSETVGREKGGPAVEAGAVPVLSSTAELRCGADPAPANWSGTLGGARAVGQDAVARGAREHGDGQQTCRQNRPGDRHE